MKEINDITRIKRSDLQKSDNLLLSDKQLNILLGKTPKSHVYSRPAKGGGQWQYVTAIYIQKCLNLVFGWDWDFEIVDEKILDTQVIVKGKLVCRTKDRTIIKMQYGRKDISFKKGTKELLDIGNDLKAAASDSLKKCASLIGIASDVYGKDEFKEIKILEKPETSEVAESDMVEHDGVSYKYKSGTDKYGKPYEMFTDISNIKAAIFPQNELFNILKAKLS